MEKRSEQELLHDFIASRLQLQDTINAMMDFQLGKVDMGKREVTLSFPIKPWQRNPMGVMHGGMICTALDITMGCVAYTFSNGHTTPTIAMSVNFVGLIPVGDELIVSANADHTGSRFVQLRAVATLKSNGEVVATAVGSYTCNKEKVINEV